MHILFLSDNFPPEVNAPASRTFEHCREWAAAGHKVTVVTCAPNFPHGRVYAGYRNRLWQSETVEHVRVIRVWTYVAPNAGFVRRVLDFQSFMVAAVLASLFIRRVDVIVGTSPQFFTVCGAWLASAFKRVPFVFELRDIWPESIKAVGASRDAAWLRGLEWIELFLYRRASAIVAVTHAFRANLAARGIDPGKISVVTNGVDTSRFRPQKRDDELVASLGLAGKFIAGYIGTLGMAHGLDTILDAASQLQTHPGGDRIAFLLLGDGAEKAGLMARARQRGLTNVVFIDTVPKDQVARYWALLDASIIHLRDQPLFSAVIPSKLFECFGMGLPVLLGLRGEAAEILRQEDAGLLFGPEDANALVERVLEFAERPDMCARYGAHALAAAGRYDRRALAKRMLDVLDHAAQGALVPTPAKVES